jgi:YggT family protein
MLLALISIIGYLMTILSTVVIVQFILSLLISFNVVSLSNNIVASIWHALSVSETYPQNHAGHWHD